MEWLDTFLSPMLEVSCDAPHGGGCLRILAWLQEAVNFVLQLRAKVPVNYVNCPDFFIHLILVLKIFRDLRQVIDLSVLNTNWPSLFGDPSNRANGLLPSTSHMCITITNGQLDP